MYSDASFILAQLPILLPDRSGDTSTSFRSYNRRDLAVGGQPKSGRLCQFVPPSQHRGGDRDVSALSPPLQDDDTSGGRVSPIGRHAARTGPVVGHPGPGGMRRGADANGHPGAHRDECNQDDPRRTAGKLGPFRFRGVPVPLHREANRYFGKRGYRVPRPAVHREGRGVLWRHLYAQQRVQPGDSQGGGSSPSVSVKDAPCL